MGKELKDCTLCLKEGMRWGKNIWGKVEAQAWKERQFKKIRKILPC